MTLGSPLPKKPQRTPVTAGWILVVVGLAGAFLGFDPAIVIALVFIGAAFLFAVHFGDKFKKFKAGPVSWENYDKLPEAPPRQTGAEMIASTEQDVATGRTISLLREAEDANEGVNEDKDE
ncbi:hypothetical protein [Streptomyces sp. MUM 178J]|uniref:hypothetical protein n=1 Tax=Streptomyces sp. MUM 178J TaxID=2791991 RepID=UPI001F04EE25|nr:hypothetical protein [Streptomyces sp. MUM 178J]WRQ81659.1 hypothetical protein I3F59_021155 [Streptomyces sp. MUM 178J]